MVEAPLVLEGLGKHIAKKFPKHLEEFEKLLRLLPYVMVPDPTRRTKISRILV